MMVIYLYMKNIMWHNFLYFFMMQFILHIKTFF